MKHCKILYSVKSQILRFPRCSCDIEEASLSWVSRGRSHVKTSLLLMPSSTLFLISLSRWYLVHRIALILLLMQKSQRKQWLKHAMRQAVKAVQNKWVSSLPLRFSTLLGQPHNIILRQEFCLIILISSHSQIFLPMKENRKLSIRKTTLTKVPWFHQMAL